jgi:hypothetical protein
MKISLLVLLLLIFGKIWAQDDLLNSLDKEISDQINYTAYTFKSTHIINGQSVENMRTNQLDVRINHRFGELNSGLYDLFGLDEALINFSLDYGITDRLMIGIRRGTYEKTYDGSIKYLLFRQCTGKRNFPVTISYFTDFAANTLIISTPFNQRLSYTHQFLIARKINEELSLQLSPSFVHRNIVQASDVNDDYSLGFGGRYKFVRRVALTWEYFYSPQVAKSTTYYNPIAIGFDIETGGHVFQLFVTNSRPMVEKGMIAETTGDIKHGGLYLGFNISRVFAFGKNKE